MPLNAPAFAPRRAILDQAIGLHRAGRLADAQGLYRQILAADPDNADALNLSGLVYLAQGDADEAIVLIARAVKIEPKSPMYLLNLGSAQMANGVPEKAVVSFERALKIKPDLAEAWAALGLARAARREERKAAFALRRAVALDPNSVEAWNNLALVLGRLGDIEDARAAADEAIARKPDFATAHNSAGVLARQAGDTENSIARLERAVALKPDYFEARNNLAVSLGDAARYDDAVAAFEAALALKADHGETWRALAKPLAALGDMTGARDACQRALALAPNDRRAHWERALIDLLDGRFADGWAGYRARGTVDRNRRPMPTVPLGPRLNDRTVVLEGEQGLGEELFFLRFARALKERGARLVARVDARLVAMVARMPFIDDAVARDSAGAPPAAAADCFLLGDLPWLAGAGDAAVPPAPIGADHARLDAIGARLAAAGPPPYVAVTWRAGIAGRETLYKEAPVDVIAEALAGRRATAIALQRNPHDGEIAAVARALGRPLADFTDLNDDLEDMLALMHLIGDYIAVSNTNVHLAAAARAAGAPVRAHVLVPCPAEFRWLAAGEGSPWFPGFTVHRAEARAGWQNARASLRRAVAGI